MGASELDSIKEHSRDMLNLKGEHTNKNIFLYAFLILLLLNGFSWGVYYLDCQFIDSVQYYKNQIVNLGLFSKSILLSYFYGYKILKGDESFTQLYKK